MITGVLFSPTAGGGPVCQSFTSTDVPKAIPSYGVTSSTISVLDPFIISDINVHLDITHTCSSDLWAVLKSPEAQYVLLFNEAGGCNSGMSGTVLDDEADTSIQDASSPFSGCLKPAGDLSVLDGHDAQGEWTLVVYDWSSGDSGSITNWSLDFGCVCGSEGEGEGQGEGEGEIGVLEECPPSSVYSHPPAAPYAEYSGPFSDGQFQAFDNFIGVNDPVTGVRWWGSMGYSNNCVREPNSYTISFYQDNNGMPGPLYFEETVTPTYELTGTTYLSDLAMYRFTAWFTTPKYVAYAWISIKGQGDASCVFGWCDSYGGDHYSVQDNSVTYFRRDYDLAFCLLTGEPGEGEGGGEGEGEGVVEGEGAGEGEGEGSIEGEGEEETCTDPYMSPNVPQPVGYLGNYFTITDSGEITDLDLWVQVQGVAGSTSLYLERGDCWFTWNFDNPIDFTDGLYIIDDEAATSLGSCMGGSCSPGRYSLPSSGLSLSDVFDGCELSGDWMMTLSGNPGGQIVNWGICVQGDITGEGEGENILFDELCPDNALLSQPLYGYADELDFYMSNGPAPDHRAYENFSGITEPITGIRWWGVQNAFDSGAGDWLACTRSMDSFWVAFFTDDGGMPGSEVYFEEATVTPTDTGLLFPTETQDYPVYQYDLTLWNPVSLNTGWVMVFGVNDTTCKFFWLLTNAPGDNTAQYLESGMFSTVNGDFAMCLLGAPSEGEIEGTIEGEGGVEGSEEGQVEGEIECIGNVVADGGFETGTPNTAWAEQSVSFGTPLCSEAMCGHVTSPHSGLWWCWFGGNSGGDDASLTQALVIPDVPSVTLQFYLKISDAGAAGNITVLIDGNAVFAATEADEAVYSTYAPVNADVSAYADGLSHTLVFQSHTEGPINICVDDVCLSTGLAEGQVEGQLEGEGSAEGQAEGITEGSEEGLVEGEGVIEGEGIAEGQAEGVIEGEGIAEGQVEGVIEGEGIAEGQVEGVIEGEGIAEGQAEGVIEGEGIAEGQAEGVIEGEGVSEGLPEGAPEGINEGATEGVVEGEEEDGFLTADQDKNGLINLSELLRVIQFFNSNGFHCEAGTEDGYAPGPGDTSCEPYDSDYNLMDWHISLSELLRVIQFFNSGGYHYCPGESTEDGFCPGPA